VMFRVGKYQNQDVIDVLRVLHDAMDLQRHLSPESTGK
jgi:plasmid stabilization system protein ParE